MIDENILISNWFYKIADSYCIHFFNIGVYIIYDISWTLFIQKKILGSPLEISKYTIKSISEDRLIKNVNAYRFISDSIKFNTTKVNLNLIANDLNHQITVNGSSYP